MSKTYAVIIPHYNDVPRLVRCLEALMPQIGPDDEVIVADNASPVSLDPISTQFPNVRIVIQPEKGAGPARNMGVAETQAQWILFIDADCVPASDWIETAKRIGKEGHVIGGRVDVFDETPAPRSGAEAFEAVFAFHMQSYLEKGAFLGAGNLVTTRTVFDGVGPFRPAVSEDKDWSQRADRAGFTLGFDNDFVVSHPSRQDWPALRHKWRRLTSEGFLLDAQGLGGRIKWFAKAFLMPVSILAHIPRVMRHGALSAPDKMRAIGTLVKLRLMRMVWMMSQSVTGKA